jgi:hypothetical protein
MGFLLKYGGILDSAWPSEEEARAVAIFWRGADDFAHGKVDWLAAGRLAGSMAGAEVRLRPGTAPMVPLRAKRALDVRRAIVSADRPTVRGEPVSFETLGAVYYLLTAGEYRMECPNYLSPQGKHRWRFAETAPDGRRCRTCDYCGDERLSPS